jgi:hypothetical protein
MGHVSFGHGAPPVSARGDRPPHSWGAEAPVHGVLTRRHSGHSSPATRVKTATAGPSPAHEAHELDEEKHHGGMARTEDGREQAVDNVWLPVAGIGWVFSAGTLRARHLRRPFGIGTRVLPEPYPGLSVTFTSLNRP